MSESVKSLRETRVTETEERILRAAARLFVRHGYQGTTLAQIADAAGVSHRTVYVRFGTKPELLKRVTDVALVGDTKSIDVAHRDWFQTALTARDLDERINALADGTADLMRRTADLFEVVLQAQATEPVLAQAFQAGRTAVRDNTRAFVEAAINDGVLRKGADAEWLAETVAVVLHAETCLLLRRTRGWRNDDYRDWLRVTLQRLFTAA